MKSRPARLVLALSVLPAAGLRAQDWQAETVDTLPSGVSAVALAVGDADGDGLPELYAATWQRILRYDWQSGAWHRSVVATVGDWSTRIAIGDGDGDGQPELYFTGGADSSLYRSEWTGSGWSTLVIGATPVAGRDLRGIAVGDGDGDGQPEVYAGDAEYANGTLYRFAWSGGSWTRTVVGSGGAMDYVALGDADRDGASEVYADTQGHTSFGPEWDSVHHYRWTGSAWADTKIFENPWRATYGLVVADGDGDGLAELFFSDVGGDVYRADFASGAWSTSVIANTGYGTLWDLAFGPVERNGRSQLVAGGNQIAVFDWTGSAWQRADIYVSNCSHRGTVVGDGDADGDVEIYLADDCAGTILAFERRPVLDASNVVAGQVATLTASHAAGPLVYFAASTTGGGPTTLPAYGITLDLSPPILQLGQVAPAPDGTAVHTGMVPPSMSGQTAWLQAVSGSSGRLLVSNGLAVAVP